MSTELSSAVVAAIGLGANEGDREAQLAAAMRGLERTEGVVVLRRSRWIETDPVGGPPGQGPYLNGAALVETRLSPEALLEQLIRIERKLGREREAGEQNGPRVIDLDLLIHGSSERATPDLTVPHPRMIERRFVLEPLAELCPDRIVPGVAKTVGECLLDLKDRAPLVEFENPELARAWCAEQRAAGHSIGFIPTMGALHEGHLELVRRAQRETDRVCVSIFVNPLQFDQPEDLNSYARDFAGDARQLATVGCAMVFTGTLDQFFPQLSEDGSVPESARVAPGPGALGLEGEHRPGHFEGVATIVDRLFELVQPERAYFGRKDFQQTLVVSDLVARRSAGHTVQVIVCPTTRDASGLALSSRNRRLTEAGRVRALAIPRALAVARGAWIEGERQPGALRDAMLGVLASSGLEVEYAEVRDPRSWTEKAPEGALRQAVALIGAVADGVRLIDNHDLGEDFPGAR